MIVKKRQQKQCTGCLRNESMDLPPILKDIQTLWDLMSLWLIVTALILIIASLLISPYYGRTNLPIKKKRLANVSIATGCLFLTAVAVRIITALRS